MTNYERIKNMSAEEMAKFHFCNAKYCEAKEPEYCEKESGVNGLTPCEDCFKIWLESEVD